MFKEIKSFFKDGPALENTLVAGAAGLILGGLLLLGSGRSLELQCLALPCCAGALIFFAGVWALSKMPITFDL